MTRPLIILVALLASCLQALAQSAAPPPAAKPVIDSLKQSNWQELQDGLSMLSAITPEGLLLQAYRISPSQFRFSVVGPASGWGSSAREIGEREGAVIVANAGFFAVRTDGSLYPVGYHRIDGEVLSKGWDTAGGTVSFEENGIDLNPSHWGIPRGDFDVIQTRPMLIEPGGKWAMGSNSGQAKHRTLLCKLNNGDVVLATVTRAGLTLFESGWIMRSQAESGFFGCDSAVALDGGRSTQVWHSGEENLSHPGATPVYSFFVVSQREER